MPAKKKVKKTGSKKTTSGTSKNLLKRQIWSVILIMLGIFLFLCVLPFTSKFMGAVGPALKNFFTGIYGFCGFFLPFLSIYIAYGLIKEKTSAQIVAGSWLIIGIFTCMAVCFSLFYDGGNELALVYKSGQELLCGGVVGTYICLFLSSGIGKVGTVILMLTLIIIFIIVCTRITLKQMISRVFPFRDEKVREDARKRIESINEKMEENEINLANRNPLKREIKIRKLKNSIDVPIDSDELSYDNRVTRAGEDDISDKSLDAIINLAASSKSDANAAEYLVQNKKDEITDERIGTVSSDEIDAQDNIDELISEAISKKMNAEETNINSIRNDKTESLQNSDNKIGKESKPYRFPPLSILRTSVSNNIDVSGELKQNAKKLIDTLQSFGVSVSILNVARGPSVTRYELQPAPGVKISKITNLADDIALNLAASAVRIEAPIPGKAAVGIEVPNRVKSMVSIKEILESKEFKSSKSKLTVALGKDISGNIQITDLSKMPHLLIAGTTGSGKSVCLNALITSILYKASPDEVKLLMIDPKTVEFRIYNGIPHLLIPVVTDPKKASGALNWAVSEMLKRYKLFADNNVRDIKGYNSLCDKNSEFERMSQVVIIIDELADLMMAAPGEVEDAICRLAQMARAAGMHLVIATQRPSVNVLTGTIKANIPSRIALFVSSQVDSRVILDSPGAEKLLGNGDMLFSPVGSNKPLRIQGCFVSDSETEQIIDYIRQESESNYDSSIVEHIENSVSAEKEKSEEKENSDRDALYPEALRIVVEAGMASATLLQRKLKLGYARAARIIDELEEAGIIGPYEGAKPRSVFMSKEQYQEKLMHESCEFTPKGEEI